MARPRSRLRLTGSPVACPRDGSVHHGCVTPRISRGLSRWLLSLGLVAAITGVIALLEGKRGASGLVVLYLFAVLPVAVCWGVRFAVVVSVASTATFNFFFVAPLYQFTPSDSDDWISLATFLLTAVVVGQLAARLRRQADESARLAEEQAALRRVATLVAQGVVADELFGAVTEEVGALLGADLAAMVRYDADDMLTIVATWPATGEHPAVESRIPVADSDLALEVLRTGRPARLEGNEGPSPRMAALRNQLGIRSSIACPIAVEGRPWGGLVVHSKQTEPLPADTESRLMNFSELVATAIANAENRAHLDQLAEGLAALRRVATLVARGAPQGEVFATVTEEVGRLLGTGLAAMARYDSDDTVTVVATWAAEGGHGGAHPLVPGPWPLDGGDVASTIARTGDPVRIDDYRGVPGRIAAFVRDELGVRGSVGSPIVVEGRLWGALFVHSRQVNAPFARDTESRLTEFTELVATAIANAENRTELMASRARIVAAADETRRRIERDLHDGIQQRLVSLVLELRAAQATVPSGLDELEGELSSVAKGLASASDELREIARGIHPAILSEGGLVPALRALCRRSPVPVALDLRAERRLPQRVEVAAYYVVSEALTNAAKHAGAHVVHVELDTRDTVVRLEIRDDGVGGADPRLGSGLIGLSDRVDAVGGRLDVRSPAGSGTTLLIEVPVDGP
jgi:signal transduction histidine kinase